MARMPPFLKKLGHRRRSPGSAPICARRRKPLARAPRPNGSVSCRSCAIYLGRCGAGNLLRAVALLLLRVLLPVSRRAYTRRLAVTRWRFQMRNRTSVILSGLGIIALLALAPNPAAARGGFGGFHGGGFGGFHGGGFSGVRAGGFGPRGAMAMTGFRGGAVVRPGWGGAVRPGWGAVRPGWGGGWRGGWARGGWGWGWPVAAGIATGVALAAPWGWGYGDDCTTYWDGFAWVNTCGYGPYAYGW
jgi:hypothetical protein